MASSGRARRRVVPEYGSIGEDLQLRDDVVDFGERRVRSHFIDSRPTFLFQPGAGESTVFLGVPQRYAEQLSLFAVQQNQVPLEPGLRFQDRNNAVAEPLIPMPSSTSAGPSNSAM